MSESLERAKFHGLCSIVGLVGLVPLCHRDFVGISWGPNFFSWVFRESQIFSRGYFVGPKFFLVGISWVQNFLSCGEFRKFQLLAAGEKVA